MPPPGPFRHSDLSFSAGIPSPAPGLHGQELLPYSSRPRPGRGRGHSDRRTRPWFWCCACSTTLAPLWQHTLYMGARGTSDPPQNSRGRGVAGPWSEVTPMVLVHAAPSSARSSDTLYRCRVKEARGRATRHCGNRPLFWTFRLMGVGDHPRPRPAWAEGTSDPQPNSKGLGHGGGRRHSAREGWLSSPPASGPRPRPDPLVMGGRKVLNRVRSQAGRPIRSNLGHGHGVMVADGLDLLGSPWTGETPQRVLPVPRSERLRSRRRDGYTCVSGA